MIKAIIEIPKGDSTRRYYNKSENKFVEIGSLKDLIPINNGAMPVNFGFTPDAHNSNNDNALDILVLSNDFLMVGQELEVTPIAILRRSDGEDKVVTIDKTLHMLSWDDVDVDLQNLIMEYFGYKSRITSVGGKDEAESYLDSLSTL